jgi:uroporphyrin-III C-methyltransferase
VAAAFVVFGEDVRLRAGLDWLGAIQGRTLDPDPMRRGRQREAG